MSNPTGKPPAPRRAKHLIDPDNPRPVRRAEPMSVSQVQRWVMSSLAVLTIAHMSAGLIIAAMVMDPERTDARIGLNVIAGGFGIMAMAAALAIHRRSLLSPWLLLGLLPTAVGLYLTFG